MKHLRKKHRIHRSNSNRAVSLSGDQLAGVAAGAQVSMGQPVKDWIDASLAPGDTATHEVGH